MQTNHDRICGRDKHEQISEQTQLQQTSILPVEELEDDQCNDDSPLDAEFNAGFGEGHDNCDIELSLHQKLHINTYFDVNKLSRPPFWVRTTTKDYSSSYASSSWETYVMIFEYVRSNQLSQQQGNNLLQLFQDVSHQHKISLPLPTNMETIQNACMRNVQMSSCVESEDSTEIPLKVLHRIEISTYKLPTVFFASVGKRDKRQKAPLYDVISARMNLPYRIAEVLLDIDPNDFAFHAPSLNGDISEFAHGSVFRELDLDAKRRLGPNAVALCLSISLDNATVNSSRNRSECPVIFSILNVKGTASYNLIGYCPIRLPYSDAELAAMTVQIRTNLKFSVIAIDK
jgi:hypothetical protein